MRLLFILPTLLAVAAAELNFVCYYISWSRYRQGDGTYSTANVDPMKCTHLIYSFAVLNSDSKTMQVFDSADLNPGGYESAVALKQKNPRLKVMIAIGGWTDSQDPSNKYSALVSSPTAISKFVTNAVLFLEKYRFDGLDLDWEYPKTTADKAGFANLCKALKTAFQPRGYILTAALGANKKTIDDGYDLQSLAQSLDFVNLMAYDMHGPWEKKADHHAPLYKRSFDADDNNIDYIINYFKTNQFPLSKINMGIPLYGVGWTLSGLTSTIPAPALRESPAGPYTGQGGVLAYYEICTNTNLVKVSDASKRNGPYAYNLAASLWVSFDDPEMASVKAKYIKEKGLAGAMVWDLSTDDFKGLCRTGVNPIMSAIYNELYTIAPVPTTTTTTRAVTTATPATTTKPTTTTTTKATTTTTKATTTTKPTGVFVCPGSGLYPDPTTCAKFYNCANGIAYSMSCGAGLYFNPTYKVCDWPYNVPSCSSG